MPFRRLLPLLSAFALLASSGRAQVKVSLIAAETSVQPGHPFSIALRLDHQEHWHTYWINPGTGYATTLEWALPPGWKAGPIEWPTPRVIKDSKGNITGNGYEGEAFLPVTLTPPTNLKPGEVVKLSAKAAWLMCAESCVPGEAKVELSLPVAVEPPQLDKNWSAKLSALAMPRPMKDWTVSAQRVDKTVVLRLTAKGESVPKLNAPHFFADDGYIEYDQPQTVHAVANGLEFVLPISASADAPASRLVGVISTQEPFAGLRVDTPIEGSAPAASTTPRPPTDHASTSRNGQSVAPSPPAAGLGANLVLAFLGGLILNLMPCVFPVLGIKILGFVHQAGQDRSKVVAHGLVFTAGVLASFWALAGALVALRAGGAQLGWGFQLQSPVFVFGLAALMLIFAMNMSGVFEFGLSATGVGSELQTKTGYSGSFFTGVLATIVATPCSAPFLAPALGAALALSPFESFLIFTVIAIGLSTPYLLLSLFPSAVKILPRPGAWMETFKQFMAFPLYATTAYLVWVLAGQTNEESFQNVLFGLVLIAMSIWVYGRWHAPGASAGRARFAVLGLTVLLLAGVWLGWPRTVEPRTAGSKTAPAVVWEPWSPEAVAKLRSEGRLVYVDFTARWCATCQANKKLVFHSDEVLRTFADKKIVTLRGDWTNKDPRITEELAKYGRSAVPFNLVYKPDAPQPSILPELLTPGVVLKAVN